MKFKIIFSCITICYILFFCTLKPTGTNKLITDYEDISGSIRTDLNLKIISIEKLKGITVRDSLRQIQFQLTKEFYPDSKQIDSSIKFDESIKLSDKMLNVLKKSMNVPDMQFIMDSKLKYDEWFQRKYKLLNLQSLDFVYKNQDTSKILLNKYKCTYTIKNPLLNGTKQEITHVYFINNSLSTIIKRDE